MKIGILGAGTLAAFIIDILRRLSGFEVIGQFDDRYPSIIRSNDNPVLGRVDDVEPGIALALAIGAPALRKTIYESMRLRGFNFPPIIDPSCVVSESAIISNGVVIGPFCTLLAGSVVHKGACLLSHVNANQDITVGAFALIGAGVIIGNGAVIGTGAHIGLGSRIPLDGIVEDWSDVSSL